MNSDGMSNGQIQHVAMKSQQTIGVQATFADDKFASRFKERIETVEDLIRCEMHGLQHNNDLEG
jgi:hypothetical protein